MKDLRDFAFIGMTIVAIGLYVSLLLVGNMYSGLRKEAVERGHAEYVTDSDGNTTWQWKGGLTP